MSAINEAVWLVIGPACYYVYGALIALYVVLSVFAVILAGAFSPKGWIFGRSMPFSQQLFGAADSD